MIPEKLSVPFWTSSFLDIENIREKYANKCEISFRRGHFFFNSSPFFLLQSRLHMYSKLKCNDILSTFFCMRIEFAYLKLRMIYIFLYLESFHFSVWPFNNGVAVLMKLSRWNETLNAYVEYYFHR